MADPLSVAAGVGGLVSLSLQATEYLVKYYQDYRHRHADLARTTEKLEGLLQSLEILSEVIKNRKWRADEENILSAIESSVSSSEGIIHELQEEVRKFEKDDKGCISKIIKVSGRNVTYPFRKSTLLKLAEDVDDFKQNLSVALQILQVKNSSTLDSDIEEIKNIVKVTQAYNVAAGVRDWLKAPDSSVDYNIAHDQRHARTGEWLVKGTAFREWLERDSSFLWLYGFAGCGKSVLCSTAIQHTFRHVQPQKGCAVGYFFFTFRDDSKQDAAAFLRATLLQLCSQVAGVEEELTRLKKSSPDGYPPTATLLEYVRQAITRSQRVYILLDALDESPDDGRRAKVLSVIQTMRQWSLPNLHLLVTSRDILDIRQSLDVVGDCTIELRNESINDDISQYVSEIIEHDPQLSRWGSHRETIKEHLSQKARGVFRWVECQLGSLRRCPQSPRHLKRCLNSLPQSLDETYERMLCSIGEESADEARSILTFLCFSSRPLLVNEVIDAIAVDLDSECFDAELKVATADDLLRICPGLIEIYEDTIKVEGEGPSPGTNGDFVRIAHFSVQEFLLSDRIHHGSAREYALSYATGHPQIGIACLIYLCNEDFLRPILTLELLGRYPFASFAANHWYEHRDLERTGKLTIFDVWSWKLFAHPESFSRWIRLSPPDRLYEMRQEYDPVVLAPPLYYAAFLGLEHLVLRLLSELQVDVNGQGGIYGNALQAASTHGDENVVRILLDRGADIHASGGEYGSALQAACRHGHEKVVQILVDAGADVNLQEEEGRTALLQASIYGSQQVVQILLDAGANVNTQDKFGNTPLSFAVMYGYERIVEKLLEAGVNVDAQDEFGNTPLSFAVMYRYERIVEKLLEAGANIDAQDEFGHTPLSDAAKYRYERIVEKLLKAGALVNEGASALWEASRSGDEEVVKMLLDAGADVNATTGRGTACSVLQAACGPGHEKVVRMLLDAGADVNARASGAGNPHRI